MREETPFFSIKRGFLSQTLTFPKRTTKGSFTPLETLIFFEIFFKNSQLCFFQASLGEIIKILSQTVAFLKRTTKGSFTPLETLIFFVAFELGESYAMFNTAVTVCFILFQEGLGFRLCLLLPLLGLRIFRLCRQLGLECSLH